tara:strand:- start:18 stop:173 length:156 start_codon:yes stop_codon:yes gene_type:complete
LNEGQEKSNSTNLKFAVAKELSLKVYKEKKEKPHAENYKNIFFCFNNIHIF